MGTNTGIEWTRGMGEGATWNPIAAFVEDPNADPDAPSTYKFDDAPGKLYVRGWFCTHDSEGCRHCYAERMNLWRGNGLEYIAQNLSRTRFEFMGLDDPIRWSRPRMIFPCSMTDLFADFYSDKMIDYVFAVMALSRRHVYQVLTKRARRMFEYMMHPEREAKWMNAVAHVVEGFNLQKQCAREPIFSQREEWLPLPNVWMGVSVEDQKNAERRVRYLAKTRAALRWLSLEPLLGPVDIFDVDGKIAQQMGEDGAMGFPADIIDWVVVGGESGPGARPMHPEWVRKVRDDCAQIGMPFFFKQWGNYAPVNLVSHEGDETIVRLDPGVKCVHISGRVEDDFPSIFRPAEWATMKHFADKKNAGATLDGREHKEWPAAVEGVVQ